MHWVETFPKPPDNLESSGKKRETESVMIFEWKSQVLKSRCDRNSQFPLFSLSSRNKKQRALSQLVLPCDMALTEPSTNMKGLSLIENQLIVKGFYKTFSIWVTLCWFSLSAKLSCFQGNLILPPWPQPTMSLSLSCSVKKSESYWHVRALFCFVLNFRHFSQCIS